MSSDRNITRRQFVGTVGTSILASTAGCLGQTSSDQEPTTTSDGTTTTTSTTTTSTAPSLSVNPQQTTNPTIEIESVSLDQSGWVALHPAKSLGTPKTDEVVGAKRLDAGTHEGVTVQVDKLLSGSQTLFAMLHKAQPDDNDFTFLDSGDPPITVDGSPVMEAFTVQYTGSLAPKLDITGQESDGTYVQASRAVVDADGWLVIYPHGSDAKGPDTSTVLGKTYLKAGWYADVRVDLESSIDTDQTLYAMLHYDDPKNEAFTFPESGDPPVESEGERLLKEFQITITQ